MIKRIFLFLFLATMWASVTAQVNVTSGTQVRIVGNVHIVIQDLDFDQNGTMIPGESTVKFTGSTASAISGDAVDFYSLIIDKVGVDLSLEDSINVTEQVIFTQGNFDLAGQPLNLLTTGEIQNESETSRFFSSTANGRILRQVEFAGPLADADSGNLGLTITTTASMGQTQIIRSHDAQTLAFGTSINRYFEIIPTNNNNLNATIRFDYFDAELNSLPEGSLLLFKSNDQGNTWSLLGTNLSSTSTNFLQQGGVDDLGRITASTQTSFPVEWLEFTAEPYEDRYSLLSWVTGSEQNNEGFFVERTLDEGNNNWETIGFVPGQGTTPTPSVYEFIDETPGVGENLYRLRQIDIDGTENYSEIRNVYFEPGLDVKLYPNPAAGAMTYLEVELPESQDVRISITDNHGKTVYESKQGLLAGRNKIGIQVETLAEGMYYIRLDGKGLSVPLKLQVK